MKKYLLSFPLLVVSLSIKAQVGIGTSTPKAFLNVANGRNVLFGSDLSGAGNKFIWYGNKGAFRAGRADRYLDVTPWDSTRVGENSFAVGVGNIASGRKSVAFGETNDATGSGSFAVGDFNIASGSGSYAWGSQCTASGILSMALGEYCFSTGDVSISIGREAQSAGFGSVAIGTNAGAGGYGSIALSTQTAAAYSDRSVAIGGYIQARKYGSCVIGDSGLGSDVFESNVEDQLMMRFNGGYVLYSQGGGQNSALGVRLAPGGNAWQTISDSTRKENFRQVNGEAFLKKIGGMRLGSWNYKGQNPKQNRHYGPMAQDFYTAFGKDELGTIGVDTLINQADFDGVNLIAIQALIRKVENLEAENQVLKAENTALKNQVRSETASIRSEIDCIKKQLGRIAQ